MELLCADDLVLVAETEELLMEKVCKWKSGMELKGLRVNIGKTKVMRCQVRIGQAEDSGKYPYGVCKQGVSDNFIKCVACHRWVHKRCSGISGRLGYVADFRCRRCLDGDSAQVVLLSEVELEFEQKCQDAILAFLFKLQLFPVSCKIEFNSFPNGWTSCVNICFDCPI